VREALPPGHDLRGAAELALAEQDSWTADEHRGFWRAALSLWPRRKGPSVTSERLGSLAVYLLEQVGLEEEDTFAPPSARPAAVARALGVSADSIRRKYIHPGAMRESEVTFAASHPDFPPWRLSRTVAFDGARPLPRVQTTEPKGDDEPDFPSYYVAVADPRVPAVIRAAFVNAHELVDHGPGASIAPAPAECGSSNTLREVRPTCPIGDRLGIDGPRGLGWRWDEDWLYSCPTWRAARKRPKAPVSPAIHGPAGHATASRRR